MNFFDPVDRRHARADYGAPNKYSHRALNAYLPPRPKKPDSPFSIFMKDYSAEYRQNAERIVNTRFVNVARQEWANLSDERKQEYSTRAEAEKGNKVEALELWYKMRNMLRRPPNAYCIFTKDAWANKSDHSTVAEFSTRQSEIWRGMDANAKAPFIQRASELLARHQDMFRTLRVGGNIIPFLEGGEAYELEPAQQAVGNGLDIAPGNVLNVIVLNWEPDDEEADAGEADNQVRGDNQEVDAQVQDDDHEV